MNKELELYKAVLQDLVEIKKLSPSNDNNEIVLKLKKMYYVAQAMEIREFPEVSLKANEYSDDVSTARFAVEDYFNRVYARNLNHLDPKLAKNVVELDEPWRQKITSYITHIRAVLQGEDIEKRLYQSIMNKLNDLQEMVDRREARIDAAQEIFLDLTRTAGEGAKNLNPVASLGKKLWLAIEKLKGSQGEHEPKRLPPPETLGLPDPDDEG